MSKHPILKSRHHFLRRDVSFTEANDHNPEVFEECPECSGSGRRSIYDVDESRGSKTVSRVVCGACNGTGTNGDRVHYFDNNAPIVTVPLGKDGWVTCPCCGWR